MENKKSIVLIGLAILALWSLLYGILTPSKVRRQISSQPGLSQGKPPEPLLSFVPAERSLARSGYPSWGRSPFLPKGVSTSPGGKLILDGIAWDEKSPRAVINDRIVAVGDRVGGSTVVEIRKDRAILNDGSEDFELRLGRRK